MSKNENQSNRNCQLEQNLTSPLANKNSKWAMSFNVFLNDLEIFLDYLNGLYKYADDSSIVALVWKTGDCSGELITQFFDWAERNEMLCNPINVKSSLFPRKDPKSVSHLKQELQGAHR